MSFAATSVSESIRTEAQVYHAVNCPLDPDAALKKLIATYPNDAAYQIAEVYSYRGDSDVAFEWLDRASGSAMPAWQD